MALDAAVEDFIENYEHQLEGARIFGYYVQLPLFSFLILLPTIFGAIYRQRFIAYGFSFGATIIFVNFFIFGYLLDWIPGAEVENCIFRKDGVELNICFCELYQTFEEEIANLSSSRKDENRLVLQPAATMSNLSFVASGMFCLFITSFPLKPAVSKKRCLFKIVDSMRENGNPMSRYNSSIAFAYALVVIFLGPASMIYHASITIWAGVIDVSSILIWASFCLAYSISQLFFHDTSKNRDKHALSTTEVFTILFVVLTTVAIAIYIITGTSNYLYYVYLGGLAFLEIIVQIFDWAGHPINGVKRDTVYILVTIAVFITALGIWIPSGGMNNSLCPNFWGHAVWHILAACATFSMFLYYASEVDEDEIKQGKTHGRTKKARNLQREIFGEDFFKIPKSLARNGEQQPILRNEEVDHDEGKEEPEESVVPHETEVEEPVEDGEKFI